MTITYKCPSCGAALQFDSSKQKIACGHCGFEAPVEEFERQETKDGTEDATEQETGQGKTRESEDKSEEETSGAKIFNCQSCGAQLVTDGFTSATICGFCGNPSLVEDRLTGEFRPTHIIPFKINKKEATQVFRNWVKKGPLTPRSLMSEATIEKLTGMYTPFWLYNFNTTDDMNASATNSRTITEGQYVCTYTDHYAVHRKVRAEFVKVPADASLKMPDDAMDKMEPFDYNELEKFKMPYLSGYFSEKFNYTAEEMEERVRCRVEKYAEELTRNTISGYSTVSVTGNHVYSDNIGDEYVLFPVWMLNYRFRGKDHNFMLNGQTGKIVADRPISWKRAGMWFGIIFLIVFLITEIGGLFI